MYCWAISSTNQACGRYKYREDILRLESNIETGAGGPVSASAWQLGGTSRPGEGTGKTRAMVTILVKKKK